MNWKVSDCVSVCAFVAATLFAAGAVFADPAAQPVNQGSQWKVRLGKNLFNDITLSNPTGMACATCHAQQTGFTFPSSTVNLNLGPVAGIVPGRFGNRRPPTIAYGVYLPQGPPQFDNALGAFAGGLFWDGRAANLNVQAQQPFFNPNEMNDLMHDVGDPALVVSKLAKGSNAALFKTVYGNNIFSQPTFTVYNDLSEAISAFEQSPEVSPFNSKYDASLEGRVKLTASEMNGLILFTGSTSGRPGGPAAPKFAQCSLCHGIPSDPKSGPDIFTNSCFANIGVPRNTNNPFYTMTNEAANPAGFNPDGKNFVDLGLGGFLYPKLNLPEGNMGRGSNGQGDYLAINGTFKAPTLRNVDLRPYPSFVKCYMHNGVFKSLQQVVHFYNTRNLTTASGEIVDFTKPSPYTVLRGRPFWPAPEFPSSITLQNPNGTLGYTAIAAGNNSAQVGNLGLTAQEEADIVAFLTTLSDGYFSRN